MILDSSAICAAVLDEPERDEFGRRMNEASFVGIGAPTLVEAAMVLSSWLGEGADRLIAAALADADVVILGFGRDHWREALSAWTRFGRGRHPARLNFGDCLAYATARVANEPLLAKGGDFALTDIMLA